MIKGIQKQLLEDFEIFEADNPDGTDNDDGEKVLPSDVQHGFKSKVISKDIINPMLQELEVSDKHMIPVTNDEDEVEYKTTIEGKSILVFFGMGEDGECYMEFDINGKQKPNSENRDIMFKVYSYVIDCTKSFIKDFKPSKLSFVGMADSQDGIYSALLKMLSKTIENMGYTSTHDGVFFHIEKNSDINESILNELDISNLGYVKPKFSTNDQNIYKTDIDGNTITLGIDYDNKDDYWDVSYEIDGDFFSNSNNAGIAMKVYGYIISCIKSFMKDTSPKEIRFFGLDANQDKVYGMLLKSLKNYLNKNGYDVGKNGRRYIISKDKDIQEMKRFAGL